MRPRANASYHFWLRIRRATRIQQKRRLVPTAELDLIFTISNIWTIGYAESAIRDHWKWQFQGEKHTQG